MYVPKFGMCIPKFGIYVSKFGMEKSLRERIFFLVCSESFLLG
jgi:hypothetical protein